jgi:hypothetical protein
MTTLPSRALLLIREYSKPLTRPDWRTLHKISNYDLFYHISHSDYNATDIIMSNIRETDWYKMYLFIEVWGIEMAAMRYNIPVGDLININGMRYAVLHNNIMNYESLKLK